jgi:hypothetical protein
MQSDTLIVVNSIKPLTLDQVSREINSFIVSTGALTNEAQTSEEAIEKLRVVMEAVAEYKTLNPVSSSKTPTKSSKIKTFGDDEEAADASAVSEEVKKSSKKSKKRKSEAADREEEESEKGEKEHKKKKSKKEDKSR